MITAVVPVAEIHADPHSSSLIESVWAVFGVVLGHFGSFWVVMARFASFWLVLRRFGSFWLVLGSYGSFWVVLADSIL